MGEKKALPLWGYDYRARKAARARLLKIPYHLREKLLPDTAHTLRPGYIAAGSSFEETAELMRGAVEMHLEAHARGWRCNS